MSVRYSTNHTGMINYVGFNQNGNIMSVGHRDGYMFYRITDILEKDEINYRGENLNHLNIGNCLIVERLFSSGLIAFVSQTDTRVIHVYHFTIRQIICRLRFSKSVLTIKLNKERMVVCLEDSIFIYNLNTMKSVHSIVGIPLNRLGVLDMTTTADNVVIAYPGTGDSGSVYLFDAVKLSPVNAFIAHDGAIAYLKFNPEGNMIATASTKGTIIRVFSIPAGKILFEFRRGLSRCVTIHSLSFSPDSKYLASTSNTETVHIFKLGPDENTEAENKSFDWFGIINKTVSPFMPTQVVQVSKLVTTERCFATARLPEIANFNQVSVVFYKNHYIVMVATSDGFAFCYRLTPEGGQLDLSREVRVGPKARVCRVLSEYGNEPDENDELPPQVHSSG